MSDSQGQAQCLKPGDVAGLLLTLNREPQKLMQVTSQGYRWLRVACQDFYSKHQNKNGFFFFLIRVTLMAYGSSQGLGVELELQLPACATATAMQDPSCICDLHGSSQQHHVPNPLSEARDQPTSSWILVGFVSTVPQQRRLDFLFF